VKSYIPLLSQATLILLIDLLGLLAGSIVSDLMRLIGIFPWILLSYPAMLSARGAINGVLCGRLSTALHVGLIRSKFRNNTEYFYSLISSIIIISIVIGFLLGSFTYLISLVIFRYDILKNVIILPTILSAMFLASTISVLTTITLAIFTFKKGLDPDVILYPIMSSLADIIVTICYAFLVQALLSFKAGYLLVWSISLSSIFSSLIIIRMSRTDILKTITLSILRSMLFVLPIEYVAGVLLTRARGMLGRYSEIMIIYPVLIDSLGDLGSALGSITTTNLALGYFPPSFRSIRYMIVVLTPLLLVGNIYYFLISVVLGLVSDTIMAKIPFFAGFITIPLVLVIAFIIAIIGYRKGLDPDDYVNPLVSCIADTIMTGVVVSLLLFLMNKA